MNLLRQRVVWKAGMVCLLGCVLLEVVGNRPSSDDRKAWAWLRAKNEALGRGGTNIASFFEARFAQTDVSAAALARAMTRPDSWLAKSYRRVWVATPAWLHRNFPRPLDEQMRARIGAQALSNHDNVREALPVMAVALSDPRLVNQDFLVADLLRFARLLPEPYRSSLISPSLNSNSAGLLRDLQTLQTLWPDEPELKRRIGELKHELRER